MEKTYDTVLRAPLFQQLSQLGLPETLLRTAQRVYEEKPPQCTLVLPNLDKLLSLKASVATSTAPFHQQPVDFKDEFPLPPAEPLIALQYFDMFVSRSMMKKVVEETNKYNMQKYGTTLNMTVEQLSFVLGMFFRMGLVDMHRVRVY